MTGLLQRLAARATCSAWTLRSDACLPFAGSGAGLAEAISSMPAASLGIADTPPEHVAPPSPPTKGSGIHEPAPLAAAVAPRARRATPLAAMQERPFTVAPHPDAHLPVAEGAQAKAGSTNTAIPAASPAPAAVTAPGNAHKPSTAPSTMQADPQPLLPRSEAPTAIHAGGTPASNAQPLGTLRAPPALTMPRPSVAAVAAGPTEVHVHIGRIEVTAQPAAQAPKRPARERAQPLSLDAYLKQRKEPS